MIRSVKIVPTAAVPSRALEWHCAATTFTCGLILALPGRSFDLSPVYLALEETMPELFWALLVVSLGLTRLAALGINGHWRRTPVLRAGTATIGTAFWFYITSQFVIPGFPIPWVVCFTASLAVSEVHSAVRAGMDIELVTFLWKKVDQSPPKPMPWVEAP